MNKDDKTIEVSSRVIRLDLMRYVSVGTSEAEPGVSFIELCNENGDKTLAYGIDWLHGFSTQRRGRR